MATQIEVVLTTLRTVMDHNTRLENELTRTNQLLNILSTEYASTKEMLHSFTKDYALTKQNVAALTTEQVSTKNELAVLTTEQAATKQKLAALSTEYGSTKDELAALSTEHGSTKDELAALTREHASTKDELCPTIMSHYAEDIQTELVLKGVPIVYSYDGDIRTYGTGTLSAVLNIAVGDDVWIRIMNNPTNDGNVRVHGNGWSWLKKTLLVS
ncbi:Hypothetical predicted protein [Mytilus galloprovincialis]|uniref:C1q domain-containing protein n=1 Tax=Mytilus galloprovincialis TaxID=29158 RepID=A0A8B6EAK6_MYTGA|nr:Hypothetical predicted protein [Mytilus galloprovincialis]